MLSDDFWFLKVAFYNQLLRKNMPFVKVIKNKAYHSRIQTKPLRRRQGKTDYFARRRLVQQEKNKYESKKYRLVVRRTNTKFILQIIYSNMNGDVVMCSADSTELKNYGLTAGLTNYAAAYCSGMLLARRLLKQVGLADMYKPNEDINGDYFNVDMNEQDKRPFKALMDVGIAATTTGARIFGCMKGACDGGLNVPHNAKRFPGYVRGKVEEVINKRGKATGEVEKLEAHFDAKVLRDHIFGQHVNAYMAHLKKEDPAKFKRQFSKWEKCLSDNKVKSCEDLYKAVHKKILANSDRKKTESKAKKPTLDKKSTKSNANVWTNTKGGKWLRHRKLTGAERKAAVQAKFASLLGQ